MFQFNALIAIASLLLLLGCESSAPGSTSTPSSTSTPRPQSTSAIPLTETELKYALFARFGETFYCDPDFYPVARRDEMEIALERFPEIQQETEKFQAMLRHLKLESVTTFSDEQKLAVYREYKRLNSIILEPSARYLTDDHFDFSLRVTENKNEEGRGKSIGGTISTRGVIEITKEEAAFLTCPICLSKGTLIDTPNGSIPIEALQIGAAIWTVDRAGNRVPGHVLQASRTPAPASHQVVHIVLDDGRMLRAFPRHPTADGRLLSDIAVGDELDGARVMSTSLIDYTYEYTYDVLPSGDTGHYWANGILLGSTIKIRR